MNVKRPDQNRWRLLLNRNPANYRSTEQIHARFLTTGALHDSLMLFNDLLRCYCFGNFPQKAFSLYRHFCLLALSFDSFTYAFLVKTCANLYDLVIGSQLHGVIEKLGFGPDVYVQTALVDMYAVCGVLFDAKKIFDEMPERNCVTWNALITGFVRWGQLEIARSLFDEMPERSVVSWTGLIDGYTRNNRPDEAFALFRRMCEDGIQPSEITLLAILPGISNTGNARICGLIHGYGEKRGFSSCDIRVMNSLIDTYAKCGCILSASRFFEEMSSRKKNLVSWTSIISAFARHGMGKEAVQTFERMENDGWKPNRVSFLGVLSACSHGGLVDEGLKFFQKMVNEGQILPDVKHYGCLVDMLGRAGRLEEAENMALNIRSEAESVIVWRTLLGSCSFLGNAEVGERVSKKIMEIERKYGGDYVLMYNILSGAGRFRDAEGFRRLMDRRNAIRVPGCSFI